MDDLITIHPINEPEIQSITDLGEEITDGELDFLRDSLSVWASLKMDPDNLDGSKDSAYSQLEKLSQSFRSHIDSSNHRECGFLVKLLTALKSDDNCSKQMVENQAPELPNPDIPVGTSLMDKQKILSSSSDFFKDASATIKTEIDKFRVFYRNLNSISHKYPISFLTDYASNPDRVLAIKSDPPFESIPYIVLLPNDDGSVRWRLSFPMYFLINQHNVFFDSQYPYANLTTRVMLQFLFHIMRVEMIELNLDYSITMISDTISYQTSKNSKGKFDLQIEARPGNISKKQPTKENEPDMLSEKSDLCPIYIPYALSFTKFVPLRPFHILKEMMDERVLIKSAANFVIDMFIGCDFCTVSQHQEKRSIFVQINSTFSYVRHGLNSPYNIVCNFSNNHFNGTSTNMDKLSLSFETIDLKSHQAEQLLLKWCDTHYFKMFQLNVACLTSAFGFKTQFLDQQIIVDCGGQRSIELYTTGKGNVWAIVQVDGKRWKTNWKNVPGFSSLNKIKYLFFFNYSA